MKKAGDLGLGVAVPEAYGGLGMGFVSTMLVCDYISGATGSFSTALEHIRNRYYADNFIWY
jgi:alkylation response protein AidB-like acyl-CoA dehydrogenase